MYEYRRGQQVAVRRLSDTGPDIFDQGEVIYADRCEVSIKLLDTGAVLTLRRSSDRLKVQENDRPRAD